MTFLRQPKKAAKFERPVNGVARYAMLRPESSNEQNILPHAISSIVGNEETTNYGQTTVLKEMVGTLLATGAIAGALVSTRALKSKLEVVFLFSIV